MSSAAIRCGIAFSGSPSAFACRAASVRRSNRSLSSSSGSSRKRYPFGPAGSRTLAVLGLRSGSKTWRRRPKWTRSAVAALGGGSPSHSSSMSCSVGTGRFARMARSMSSWRGFPPRSTSGDPSCRTSVDPRILTSTSAPRLTFGDRTPSLHQSERGQILERPKVAFYAGFTSRRVEPLGHSLQS
jgi:hypothetical protein